MVSEIFFQGWKNTFKLFVKDLDYKLSSLFLAGKNIHKYFWWNWADAVYLKE